MSKTLIPQQKSAMNIAESVAKKIPLGGLFIMIIIACYIAGYIGVAYMSKPAFESEADEDDQEITLKLDSEGIPAYHKLILFRIFAIIAWVAILAVLARLFLSMSDKKSSKRKSRSRRRK